MSKRRQRPALPPSVASWSRQRYERHKEHARARQASISRGGRNIGDIPPCRNVELRELCVKDLRLFLSELFPETFFVPFSADHLTVIADLQEIILLGGLRANAVYRSFGKTSIAVRAIIWAALYGHLPYLPILGAEQSKSDEHVHSIKSELELNDRLLDLFPESVYPIRCLEGISQRCVGQLYNDAPSRIEWRGNRIVLPSIPGSEASGVVIEAAGITSAKIRGLSYTRSDGAVVRPGFYLLDDLQTDQSAASPIQVQRRLDVVRKAILRGKGHFGRRLAVFANGTVIEQGDVQDQLLNHELFPAFQGRRIPLLKAMPANLDVWLGPYAELRRSYDPAVHGDQERGRQASTAYYREHREQMDAGAVVSWDGCHQDDEISAIQHGMNIYVDEGSDVFASECQQAPEVQGASEDEQRLTPEAVIARLNGLRQRQLRLGRHTLVGHVDLHDKLLTWTLVAFADDWTSEIVDYGVHPEQGRRYWSLRDAHHSLRHRARGAGLEAAIQAGLTELCQQLLALRCPADSGEEMPAKAIGIDSGYKPDIVRNVVAALRDPRLVPTRGHGVKAINKPISEYTRTPGARFGDYWWIPPMHGKRGLKHVLFDANYWKRFLQMRFATVPGDPGAMTLWGIEQGLHKLIADHVAKSELGIKVEANGRAVYEYRQLPGKPDNHYFDNLVACCALASYCGLKLPGATPAASTGGRRKRVRGVGIRYVG